MKIGTTVTILPQVKGETARLFIGQTGTVIGRSSLYRGAVTVRFNNGDRADYYPRELKAVSK
jgi:DNA/RNA endonuclease YhcR with UshA esterase domain